MFIFRSLLKKINKNKQGDIFMSGSGHLLGREFNKAHKIDWTEESYPQGNHEINLTRSVKASTIFFLAAIIFLGLGIIAARTFFLQVLRGKDYYALASKNSIREIRLPAERGLIYDRNGTPLVSNIPTYTLLLDTRALEDKTSTEKEKIAELAGALSISPEDLLEIIDKFKKYPGATIPVKTNLAYEQALKLDVELKDVRGLNVIVDSKREYLEGVATPSLSHILGFIGKINADELKEYEDYLPQDSIGKTGIERFYEKTLHGQDGRRQALIDALGRTKSAIVLEEPLRGQDIKLTIDLDLQKAVQRALKNNLLASGKKRGAVVVLDPRNGQVLALVSLPAFDNNSFSGGITRSVYETLINNQNQPLFSRAISGEYPSGSTIKPMLAAAALDEGLINEHTTILSVGGLRIGKWFFPDWKVGGHGRVDLFRAIAESVNTFFYFIGGGHGDFIGLGPDKMAENLRLFGLGETLAIDLPGEAQGLLPTPEWKKNKRGEEWYIGDTYHMAIGQGDVLVTPLQISAAVAAVANGGTLFRPHLKMGNETILRANVARAENLALIRKAMRQTITGGSATRLNDLPYGIAGKTGTAQWKKSASPHAWFTGFAPHNDPEIVITVLVEEGGEGSGIALTVAREIFEYYFMKHGT